MDKTITINNTFNEEEFDVVRGVCGIRSFVVKIYKQPQSPPLTKDKPKAKATRLGFLKLAKQNKGFPKTMPNKWHYKLKADGQVVGKAQRGDKTIADHIIKNVVNVWGEE